jgi:hypothetical protein
MIWPTLEKRALVAENGLARTYLSKITDLIGIAGPKRTPCNPLRGGSSPDKVRGELGCGSCQIACSKPGNMILVGRYVIHRCHARRHGGVGSKGWRRAVSGID